eukprot:1160365-Pelagomonas_calceolata.AAC.12
MPLLVTTHLVVQHMQQAVPLAVQCQGHDIRLNTTHILLRSAGLEEPQQSPCVCIHRGLAILPTITGGMTLSF